MKLPALPPPSALCPRFVRALSTFHPHFIGVLSSFCPHFIRVLPPTFPPLHLAFFGFVYTFFRLRHAFFSALSCLCLCLCLAFFASLLRLFRSLCLPLLFQSFAVHIDSLDRRRVLQHLDILEWIAGYNQRSAFLPASIVPVESWIASAAGDVLVAATIASIGLIPMSLTSRLNSIAWSP